MQGRAHAFLNETVLKQDISPTDRPLVTLTYAQSINGIIGGPNRTPLSISSPDSLVLTHLLRNTHDAILIGIQTVISDDPKLTTRFLEGVEIRHATPVVIDPRLEIPLDSSLLERNVVVYCLKGVDTNLVEKVRLAGGIVVQLDPDQKGRLDILEILQSLKSKFDVKRLMVEGGATVIRDFLARACEVVDSIVVTVSPKFVSDSGVSLKYSADTPLDLSNVQYLQLGCDLIMFGRPPENDCTH